MALNKTDLKEIGKLFDNKFNNVSKNFDVKLNNLSKNFDLKLDKVNKNVDMKLENMSKSFDNKLDDQRKKINQDIGEIIDTKILPQISSLNDEVEGINRKLDSLFDRGDRQEKRLNNYEERITELEKVSPLIP